MRVRASIVVLLVALSGAAPAAARGATDGPTGSTLLDGAWLFRRDPAGVGLRHHWERSRSSAGWTAVTVPNAWNTGDPSVASMIGGVGWYRKDFRLPSASAALRWSVRFDSVNYRARVWVNGHAIGSHEGAFLPFELVLSHLHARATNRLVVRVAGGTGPGSRATCTCSGSTRSRSGRCSCGRTCRAGTARPRCACGSGWPT